MRIGVQQLIINTLNCLDPFRVNGRVEYQFFNNAEHFGGGELEPGMRYPFSRTVFGKSSSLTGCNDGSP